MTDNCFICSKPILTAKDSVYAPRGDGYVHRACNIREELRAIGVILLVVMVCILFFFPFLSWLSQGAGETTLLREILHNRILSGLGGYRLW